MSNNLVVYLAGGMHTNWRNQIIQRSVGEIQYINPMRHKLETEQAYTLWDLEGIERSDIVIIHMSDDNPSGYGLNLEAGYAKAKGKYIIFIDQLTDERRRYFGMLRSISDVVFTEFYDVTKLLNELSLLP